MCTPSHNVWRHMLQQSTCHRGGKKDRNHGKILSAPSVRPNTNIGAMYRGYKKNFEIVLGIPEKDPGKVADKEDQDDAHEDEGQVVLLLSPVLLTSEKEKEHLGTAANLRTWIGRSQFESRCWQGAFTVESPLKPLICIDNSNSGVRFNVWLYIC